MPILTSSRRAAQRAHILSIPCNTFNSAPCRSSLTKIRLPCMGISSRRMVGTVQEFLLLSTGSTVQEVDSDSGWERVNEVLEFQRAQGMTSNPFRRKYLILSG